MMDVMYDIPSQEDVKKFTITKEMVQKKQNTKDIIPITDKKSHKNKKTTDIEPQVREEIA